MQFHLPADKMPTAWYNALPEMPEPMQPPLHPGTREPVGPDDLAPLFPMALIQQEMSGDIWVDIPGEVIGEQGAFKFRVPRAMWEPKPVVRPAKKK